MMFLFVSLMIFCGTNSNADLFGKAPLLDEVIEIFKAGHVPENSELRFGKAWDCDMYNARPGNADTSSGVDANLMQMQLTSSGIVNQSFLFKKITPFSSTGKELVAKYFSGRDQQREYEFALRFHDKTLVAEISTLWEDETWLKSVSFPTEKAVHYFYCTHF